MNSSNESAEFAEDRTRHVNGDADFLPLMGGVELIDCDGTPVPEIEIPEDADRWTLPEIREGAAVAILICMAPALAACIAATGMGTLALREPGLDA